MMTPYSLAGDDASTLIQQDFTAELTHFHLQNPQQARTSRIFLSAKGMRLQSSGMFGPNRGGWLIQNYQDDLSWVVRPERRIYALLPHNTEADQQAGASSSGFMATRACSHASLQARLIGKKMIGSKRINGFETQVWECRFPSYSLKQFYSTDLAMVIREEHPSQQVMELRGIEKGKFGDDFFKPAGGYSEVALEEFLFGAKPLDRFHE